MNTERHSAEAAGRRVEELLDRLTATNDHEVRETAEDLVRTLMDLYGAALARIVRPLDDAVLSSLLGDELVSALLLLHDLHPEDTMTRIGRALKAVRTTTAEVAGFDEDTGTLRLRQAGTGGGCACPSTTETAQRSIEAAVSCFAPEVTSVVLEAPREAALLQITRRPPATTAAPAP